MVEKISLNFMVSDINYNHSNIVAEAFLDEDSIVLENKQILSRKDISKEVIYFNDIYKITFSRPKCNSLDYSISIEYNEEVNSKNHLNIIYLKSSDVFGVKWFYDHLISYIENYNSYNNSSSGSDFDIKSDSNNLNDKKVEDFNNFLECVNKPFSKKEEDSSKHKKKFYNFCVNIE